MRVTFKEQDVMAVRRIEKNEFYQLHEVKPWASVQPSAKKNPVSDTALSALAVTPASARPLALNQNHFLLQKATRLEEKTSRLSANTLGSRNPPKVILSMARGGPNFEKLMTTIKPEERRQVIDKLNKNSNVTREEFQKLVLVEMDLRGISRSEEKKESSSKSDFDQKPSRRRNTEPIIRNGPPKEFYTRRLTSGTKLTKRDIELIRENERKHRKTIDILDQRRIDRLRNQEKYEEEQIKRQLPPYA